MMVTTSLKAGSTESERSTSNFQSYSQLTTCSFCGTYCRMIVWSSLQVQNWERRQLGWKHWPTPMSQKLRLTNWVTEIQVFSKGKRTDRMELASNGIIWRKWKNSWESPPRLLPYSGLFPGTRAGESCHQEWSHRQPTSKKTIFIYSAHQIPVMENHTLPYTLIPRPSVKKTRNQRMNEARTKLGWIVAISGIPRAQELPVTSALEK